MQVPVLSMFFMAVSTFISIGLPVAIYVYLKRKYNAVFFPVIVGAERIFAVCIQMSLSGLVFYSVYAKFKGKLWLFPCAILLHAIIDIPAAMYQVGIIKNIIIIEVIVCVSAVVCIFIAANVHRRLKLCVTTAQETEMNQ